MATEGSASCVHLTVRDFSYLHIRSFHRVADIANEGHRSIVLAALHVASNDILFSSKLSATVKLSLCLIN
jgi:hypothetical protein